MWQQDRTEGKQGSTHPRSDESGQPSSRESRPAAEGAVRTSAGRSSGQIWKVIQMWCRSCEVPSELYSSVTWQRGTDFP